MKKLILFLFILICFNAIGQNPTNYQYRAVRERSIAQMLDSSFHFPRYNATPSGLRVGSSANSGAGAIDTIGHVGFFYSGDKWRAFGSQGFETRLVNGGKVTWDSLLVFSVAPAIYYINGAYYTSTQTYLTLDAANGALDRIDLIYLDSTGAHKETGVAAATPEEPSLPANSIRLTAILIPATATVPGGGVDTVTIYDENVEWTVSTTSLTAPSTDNTSPFHFITDIQTGAITNASILKFTATSAIDVSSFTALRFYIKLKGTFSPSTYLTVYFVRSGVKICIPIEIKNGTYGFTRTNTTSYQQITIPISDFGFTSTAADGLWFQPSGSNSSGFYMDWVQLQGGISQPVPSNTYTANLPIRITNNVISADTSRALAPSLATNAIVKKQIDSLAGTITSVNIYNSDGTLTGNRAVNANGNILEIDSTSLFTAFTSTSSGKQSTIEAQSSNTKLNSSNNGTSIAEFETSVNDPFGDGKAAGLFGRVSGPTYDSYIRETDSYIQAKAEEILLRTTTGGSSTGDRYLIEGTYKTLTESSATPFVRVNIPTSEVTGGEILITVEARDASDFQSRTLRFIWSAVNKAGTITVTVQTPEEAVAVSTGTLTVTIDTNDAGSGNLDFRANAVSSLTQTILRCSYQVKKNIGTGAITAQ